MTSPPSPAPTSSPSGRGRGRGFSAIPYSSAPPSLLVPAAALAAVGGGRGALPVLPAAGRGYSAPPSPAPAPAAALAVVSGGRGAQEVPVAKAAQTAIARTSLSDIAAGLLANPARHCCHWTPAEMAMVVELFDQIKPATAEQYGRLTDAFNSWAKGRGSPARSLESIKAKFAAIARLQSTGGGAEPALRTRACTIRMRIHQMQGSSVIVDAGGPKTAAAAAATAVEDGELVTAEEGDSVEARMLEEELKGVYSKASTAVQRAAEAFLPKRPLSAPPAAAAAAPAPAAPAPPPRKKRMTLAATLREVLGKDSQQPAGECRHDFALAQLPDQTVLYCRHCAITKKFVLPQN